MNSDISKSTDLNGNTIYEGGVLCSITAKELLNNEVGIRQVLNDLNLVKNQLSQHQEASKGKDIEIAFLKTSPFIAIFAAIFNIIGLAIVAIGCNLLTSDPKSKMAYWLLISGILVTLSSNLLNILYPYAIKWFDKQKEIKKDASS